MALLLAADSDAPLMLAFVAAVLSRSRQMKFRPYKTNAEKLRVDMTQAARETLPHPN